ncbi:RNA polymerase II-associated [Xylariaceae sp. FL0804]|nr:RNA polymerase II-associated [Xylariaceae sp. FL0804]
MATSSRSGEHRSVHQDFIARIRYSNALPPPPNPPKLLDIPNTGLASGQYTAPGFASRLAREQPLNIEADAELGMPLDLVGMPGIFDGDESSIQAPAIAPPIHPHDRALLRPLQTLGKPAVAQANVSFLRRTEYISSVASKSKHEAGPLRALNPNPLKRSLKRPSPEPDKDSPVHVKRKIDQSFAVAEQNLRDKSRVRHPTKRHLKLVEAYPVLPDLEALPDAGAYVTMKFTTNPVPPSKTYDRRLLCGLFCPVDKNPAEDEAYQLAAAAHERDPANNPKPPASMNYDFYLADSLDTAERFRQRWDVENPDRDDDGLYTRATGRGPPNFPFPRVRGYETSQETEVDQPDKYNEELLLSFHDDDGDGRAPAVLYYPVIQRSTIKPQRTKNIARTIGYADGEERVTDEIEVTIGEPNERHRRVLEAYRTDPYRLHTEEDDEYAAAAEQEEEQEQEEEEDVAVALEEQLATTAADAAAEQQGDADDDDEELPDVATAVAAANGRAAEAGAETNGHADRQQQRQQADLSDEDQDAEGDEED